ncbi:MAG: ethanolamine utilization protein EutJ [Deltaproteobacteria bacterium]|nr:ethanolamine utilization protein EutJ [Deltaproteobacteria bacterium]
MTDPGRAADRDEPPFGEVPDLVDRPPSVADPAAFLDELADRLTLPVPPQPGQALRVGLDLGTDSIVLVALDAEGRPLGLARREASAVRDGLVVDFEAARSVTSSLKATLESRLGVKLRHAAVAVPPGTSERDSATHRHVAEAAGLETTAVWNEPEAANLVLGLIDGAVADLGGGTTGAAIFRRGRLIKSFDEPTGGHHLTLTLAGRFRLDFEAAESFKLAPENRAVVAAVTAPVLSKMGLILKAGLAGHVVKELILAGGCSAAPQAGPIVARETGLKVRVAHRPDLVTPAGIALGCPAAGPDEPF